MPSPARAGPKHWLQCMHVAVDVSPSCQRLHQVRLPNEWAAQRDEVGGTIRNQLLRNCEGADSADKDERHGHRILVHLRGIEVVDFLLGRLEARPEKPRSGALRNVPPLVSTALMPSASSMRATSTISLRVNPPSMKSSELILMSTGTSSPTSPRMA